MCITESLLRRTHGKDDEIIDLALFFRLHPLVGIECGVGAIPTRHLTGNFRRQIRDIELFDTACAAFTIEEPPPTRLDSASERRHHAEACDDDAPHLRLLAKGVGLLAAALL